MVTRTAEEIVKFDSGLCVGRHFVRFTNGRAERDAIIEIGWRGAVYVFARPNDGDMYSSWQQMKGNRLEHCRKYPGVFVWGGRVGGTDYVRVQEMFNGVPEAIINLNPDGQSS